jgi:hypothetical protein
MATRGRKPKGEFTGKLAHFSTRIQVETRKALEREAKASGQSISQLAERLLIAGLAERQGAEKDRPIRALGFLISEIARLVVGPTVSDGKREATLYHWRSDPFFYRAFTIAVGRVLDALSPPGEIKPPRIGIVEMPPEKDDAWDAGATRYVESFKSPEARAEHTADHILQVFRNLPLASAEEREKQRKLLSEFYSPSLARQFYGMPEAAHDLAIKPRSGKMVEIKLSLTPFSWGPEK